MLLSKEKERSTSTFDFASYHTLDEVICSAESFLIFLGPCRGCVHGVTSVVVAMRPLGPFCPPWGESFVEPGEQGSLLVHKCTAWALPAPPRLAGRCLQLHFGVKPCPRSPVGCWWRL